MFTCERCGKDFTKKSNLTRHRETHPKEPTVSGQTYCCGECDKVFSRPDHRKRHEAAHSYSLTCGVCGQYLNRMDNLARHSAHHERPEAKQRLPLKRPATPEPGPSPKQRSTVLPPKTPMGILLDQTCCQRTQRPERCIDNIGSPSVQRRRPTTLFRGGTTLRSMR